MRTTATRQTCALIAALATLAVVGCGTNFETILFQTGSALGRTFVDRLLTDVANSIADSFDAADSPTDGTGDVGDSPPDAGTGGDPADGGSLDTLTGDATDGEVIFAANGCAGCHCADAGGGCTLDAPSLPGVTAGIIDSVLRGDNTHPIKVDLSDQDIADLETYLASLG